ncbi:MAG: dihydrofolate reductase [Clostridiales bacterium]|nr:dihydrofolate reductase [Clostridiales bacterium]MBS5877466.1 dihydrofolate reductase [Clostridiales bacterium]MDU0938853.1 dihydrofolate reductase [Clostridiales bacterium]MDU1041507.1 dihydrofolate reductase [Clostridiales bacterium]
MIGLIAAFAKGRVIGSRGRIPWNIPGEQTRFRKLTTGNIIIMGRISYEEIGYPLPGRITIVVSTSKSFSAENCYTVNNIDEALALAEKIAPEKDIYFSGGEQIYKKAMDIVDKMYITEIDLDVEGDTFFPEFMAEEWEADIVAEINGDVSYRYITYTRKDKK